MDELKKEIQELISSIEKPGSNEGDVDAIGLFHLKQVAEALEYKPHRLGSRIARLNRFWMDSVPWCSRLSKELEKVLIMYSEATEKGN